MAVATGMVVASNYAQPLLDSILNYFHINGRIYYHYSAIQLCHRVNVISTSWRYFERRSLIITMTLISSGLLITAMASNIW